MAAARYPSVGARKVGGGGCIGTAALHRHDPRGGCASGLYGARPLAQARSTVRPTDAVRPL